MSADVPGIPGASIRETTGLPRQLAGAARVGLCVDAMAGAWLLAMPRVGRFHVTGGTDIAFEPARNAERELVDVILDTGARAALIQERGELALEAATMAAPGGRAVALCGFSGLGKSTIAAALSRRGWLLLADGVTRVTWDGTTATAWPSHGVLKLWWNACEQMGLSTEGLGRVRAKLEKFFVPVPAATAPAKLTAIVRLTPDPKGGVTVVPPEERLAVLNDSTYRYLQVAHLGRAEDCAHAAAGAAATTSVSILGAARRASVGELADAIESILR